MDIKTITEGIPSICTDIASIISKYTRPNMREIAAMFRNRISADILSVNHNYSITMQSTPTRIHICLLFDANDMRDNVIRIPEVKVFLTKDKMYLNIVGLSSTFIDIRDPSFELKLVGSVESYENGSYDNDEMQGIIVKYIMLCRNKIL